MQVGQISDFLLIVLPSVPAAPVPASRRVMLTALGSYLCACAGGLPGNAAGSQIRPYTDIARRLY